MALKSLKCPHCSAQIDIFDESTRRGFCPFCGVVIDDIQRYQALFAEQANGNSSSRMSPQGSDFEIVGAILKRYRGSGAEVTVPQDVRAIGEEAFADCSFITSVTLPDTLSEIHVNAFRSCSRLSRVYLGTGVESIGPGAFARCSSLSSIVIPRSCKTIDSYAFQDCKTLSSVTLPKELESVGDYAFSSTAIRSIKLPPAPLTLGSNVFHNCPMDSVVVPKGTRMVNKFQLGIDPFGIEALTQQGSRLDPGGLAATLAGFNPGLEAQPSRMRLIVFACEEDREAYDKAVIQKMVREAEKHLDSKRVELMKEIDRLGLGQRAKKKALRERLDKAYVSNKTLREYYPELRLMKPESMGKYLADNSEYMQTGRNAQAAQTPASAQASAGQVRASQPSSQKRGSEGAQRPQAAFTDYDFTDYIYDMLVNTFIEDHGIDLRENSFATKRLKLAAKSAAESFSARGEAEVDLESIAEANGSWLNMNYHIGSSN